MLLIATDEAGYGPKLGPLVVAASAWSIPGTSMEDSQGGDPFATVAGPVKLPGGAIVVNDSKTIFRPRSSSKKISNKNDDGRETPGYAPLEKVTLAGARWCDLAEDSLSLVEDLACEDRDVIRRSPWLADFAKESVETSDGAALETRWRSGVVQLVGLRARVITAAAFNAACGGGSNKSDLLSATTLSLIKSLLDQLNIPDGETIEVSCDRHGGRRYYAGPLQSVFDDNLVQVNSESKSESSYRVPYRHCPFNIRFTVKGDSYTPVAFSSLVAKYLREKAMESLNRYFADGCIDDQPLRPTAGYPVDADRFLTDIAPIVKARGIDTDQLVRCR